MTHIKAHIKTYDYVFNLAAAIHRASIHVYISSIQRTKDNCLFLLFPFLWPVQWWHEALICYTISSFQISFRQNSSQFNTCCFFVVYLMRLESSIDQTINWQILSRDTPFKNALLLCRVGVCGLWVGSSKGVRQPLDQLIQPVDYNGLMFEAWNCTWWQY